MSNRIECFFLVETDRACVKYRRYQTGKCTHGPYHNVEVIIDSDVPFPLNDTSDSSIIPNAAQKADPRWPKQCPCGYVFRDDDDWQINTRRYMQRTTGDKARFTRDDAPHGSMWYADWMPSKTKGPDGHCLIVRTPGGDWTVDYLSDSESAWTRTGDPPKITAHPSIAMGTKGSGKYYHGFLKNGFLEDCGDSET